MSETEYRRFNDGNRRLLAHGDQYDAHLHASYNDNPTGDNADDYSPPEPELNALADAIVDYVRSYADGDPDLLRRAEARLLTSKYLGEVVPA